MADLKLELIVQAAVDQAVSALRQVQAEVKAVGTAEAQAAVSTTAATEALAETVPAATAAAAALETVAAATADTSKASVAAAAAHKVTAAEAEVAGNALEKLVTSNKAATREVLVLAHELSQGNFKRFGGSLLVLGERIDAIGAVFSSTGLIIGGLIAVVGAVGVALYKGAEQADELNRAIALTGGSLGATTGELRALGDEIAIGTNGRFAEARATLTELAATGKFTAENIGSVGRAVETVADASGESTSKVIGDFEKLGEGVTKWALKANEQYHFLTLAQFEYIQQLEEQGKQSQAVAFAADALSESVRTQADETKKGSSYWHSLGVAINEAWDAMKQWGAATPLLQQLKNLDAQIADFENRLSHAGVFSDTGLLKANIEALGKQRIELQAKVDEETARAREKSEKDRENDEAIRAKVRLDNQIKLYRDNQEKLADAIKQYKADAKLVGVPQSEQDDEIAQITARFEKNKPASAVRSDGSVADARSDAASALALQRALDDEERKDLDEKLRKNEISYSDYYSKIGALAKQESQAKIDALNEETKAIDAEIARTPVDAANQSRLIALNNERKKVATEITILTLQQGNIDRDNAIKAEDSVTKLNDQLAKTAARLQEIKAETPASVVAGAAASVAQEYQGLLSKTKVNEPDKVQIVVDFIASETAKKQLADLVKLANDQAAIFRDKEAELAEQVTIGAISPEQARAEILKQRAESLKAVDEIISEADKIPEAIGDKSIQQLDKVRIGIAALKDPVDQLLVKWRDTTSALESATASWLDKATSGLADFIATGKFSFSGFVDSIIKDLGRIGINGLIAQLVGGSAGGSGLSGIGSAASGLGSLFSSGSTFSDIAESLFLAGGGSVTGPGGPTSDSIPAMLSNGEYVLSAAAVRRIGVTALDRLNGGAVPQGGIARFASGGLVGNAPAGSFGDTVSVVANYDFRGAGPDQIAQLYAYGERIKADTLKAVFESQRRRYAPT